MKLLNFRIGFVYFDFAITFFKNNFINEIFLFLACVLYSEIVKDLGVDDLLTWEQARKKWNNLVAKYKVLKLSVF